MLVILDVRPPSLLVDHVVRLEFSVDKLDVAFASRMTLLQLWVDLDTLI